MTMHIGRSWSGHPLEDDCPCPKAPCGLVDMDRTDPTCPEHPAERCKSIRQSHPASACPAVRATLRVVQARTEPFFKPFEPEECGCPDAGQCLTSTGCDHCRVFGDESCGLPIDPTEEN